MPEHASRDGFAFICCCGMLILALLGVGQEWHQFWGGVEMSDLELNLIQRVNLGDSLTRTAWRYPDKLAIVDGERRFSYSQMLANSIRLANAMLGLGYQKGDAVALMSGNSAEFLFTYFACAKVGLICVPINLGWTVQEIAYVLGHSQARAIVVESQLVGLASAAISDLPEVRSVIVAPGTGSEFSRNPSDRMWFDFAELLAGASDAEPEIEIEDRAPLSYLYTSGTTSAPKGVVSSHLGVYLESIGVALEDGFTHNDSIGAMMPLFHTAQLNGQCTVAVIVGATMVLLRGFNSSGLLRAIDAQKLTIIFGLPFMFREILDDPLVNTVDLSSLRLAIYAMAPMPDALLRRSMEVLGCDFTLGFGQTEMNPVTTVFRPENQLSHSGAVGTPEVNVLVGIMDEAGKLLPWGESGEIVYRSPQTMNGYLKNPQATAEAFRFGWFHSGDAGYFDKDGVLWFEDRFKDVIKSGGENVSSIEVEKAIYAADDGVAEAIVVGLPHPRWGEAITAFVVPKDGVTLDTNAMVERVKERLGRFKTPKSVHIVSALPRTSTGKVQKNVVRASHSDLYQEPTR